MGDDLIALVEREYQRRLAALQATRAELAAVDAALHRLVIDRPRLGGLADARAAELEQRRAGLLERAHAQRRDAQAQRDLVDRHRGTADPEPAELPPDVPGDGPPTDYMQPPFGRPL